MKKYLFLFPLLAIAAWTLPERRVTAQSDAPMPSPHLVISQFQAGGTTSSNDEFIEIHNNGSSPVDLMGYRLVYRSDNGSNDVNFMNWPTTTIVAPGQYYLVASTAYTGSGSVPANITYNNTTCQCAMAAAAGGLAIRQGDLNTGFVIDAVGWGTGSNIFFETARTTAPGNSNSKKRLQEGCQDTDNNASDFATQTPSAPRNAASTVNACSGGGTTLFAAMSANPTAVSPPGNTLLTVTVTPATTPPSTGITVTGNLSAIGLAAVQPFFDDGTNGDVTPGDNVFSFLATIPAGTTGGVRTVTAVAADGQGRSVQVSQNITINAPPPNEDPLALGNPSNATAEVTNENNYLMPKPQYTLSYNRSRAIANWVAWTLNNSWLGNTPRQDDFREDLSLPSPWYLVLDNDYSNTGFNRGHMCPSNDRTLTVADNSATFLMTNIIPQAGNNNQGPWQELEEYANSTIVGQGNEMYIYSGGAGQGGTNDNGVFTNTIAQGRVVVPAFTWKVILVLPNGNDDANRVGKTTRVIAVIMPNRHDIGINTPWRNFRTTVKQVEALTGFNFFTNVRPQTRRIIKQRKDTL